MEHVLALGSHFAIGNAVAAIPIFAFNIKVLNMKIIGQNAILMDVEFNEKLIGVYINRL